jgi:hypothetical protein
MTRAPASPHDSTPETRDRLENKKIHDEMTALAREGKLDEAAIAGFDARIDAQLARISQGAEKAQADFEAAIALRKRPALPKRFVMPWSVFLLLVFIGPIIEIAVGKGFVFAHANAYRAAMPWIIALLLPLIGFTVYTRERKNPILKDRYPTWGVRWLLMFPLVSMAAAAMIATSPLGWAAFMGWATGANSTALEAKVLSVDKASTSSRGCKQYARLQILGNEASICLDGRISKPPKQGDSLSVRGRVSAWGVYIEELHPQ